MSPSSYRTTFEQSAFVGFARDDGRAVFVAFQHQVAGIQPQTGLLFFRAVAFKAMFREQRPDLILEKRFAVGSRIPPRQQSRADNTPKANQQQANNKQTKTYRTRWANEEGKIGREGCEKSERVTSMIIDDSKHKSQHQGDGYNHGSQIYSRLPASSHSARAGTGEMCSGRKWQAHDE